MDVQVYDDYLTITCTFTYSYGRLVDGAGEPPEWVLRALYSQPEQTRQHLPAAVDVIDMDALALE